jgi:hypothetical protein
MRVSRPDAATVWLVTCILIEASWIALLAYVLWAML